MIVKAKTDVDGREYRFGPFENIATAEGLVVQLASHGTYSSIAVVNEPMESESEGHCDDCARGERFNDLMREAHEANLNPAEARSPLTFNGMSPAQYIKRAYGLGPNLNGPGRFDLKDPVQQELRRIRDWITMAEHDALESRK